MSGCQCGSTAAELQSRVLWTLLTINFIMFVGESFVGWLAESTGLMADSLDMLADAAVYGLALIAVHKSAASQKKSARWSGIVQIGLGLLVLAEVIRRAFVGSEPNSILIIGMSCVALLANLVCLKLIYAHKDSGDHMRASWIFSANDAIANIGVLLSGVLVWQFGSSLPDLIIGLCIACVVVWGGIRIVRI